MNKLVMKISYLHDRAEFIPPLASRLHEERKALTPDLSIEWRMEKLRTHLNQDTLPIAWVAHDGDQLLGTASLRTHDFEGRHNLSPWLGGVYVVPEARRIGIGAALCRIVVEKAQSLAFTRLFLFTLDRQQWYAEQGWVFQESITCRGTPGVIMSKSLCSPHKKSQP
jgi:GNAT superfamily N-acetyltransferase